MMQLLHPTDNTNTSKKYCEPKPDALQYPSCRALEQSTVGLCMHHVPKCHTTCNFYTTRPAPHTIACDITRSRAKTSKTGEATSRVDSTLPALRALQVAAGPGNDPVRHVNHSSAL